MGLTTLIKRGAKRVRALRNSPKLNIGWRSNKPKPRIVKSWSYNSKKHNRIRGGS